MSGLGGKQTFAFRAIIRRGQTFFEPHGEQITYLSLSFARGHCSLFLLRGEAHGDQAVQRRSAGGHPRSQVLLERLLLLES
jgi:hypothetical protein